MAIRIHIVVEGDPADIKKLYGPDFFQKLAPDQLVSDFKPSPEMPVEPPLPVKSEEVRAPVVEAPFPRTPPTMLSDASEAEYLKGLNAHAKFGDVVKAAMGKIGQTGDQVRADPAPLIAELERVKEKVGLLQKVGSVKDRLDRMLKATPPPAS